MMTFFELFYLLAVTARAVVGCDNHGDAMAVVLKGCGIFLIGTMARVAVHILPGVGAFSPLLHNARRTAAVAVQACLAFCGDLGTSNWNQREEEESEKSYKAHGNLRSTTLIRPFFRKPSRSYLVRSDSIRIRDSPCFGDAELSPEE
jgi:hypothetical protein